LPLALEFQPQRRSVMRRQDWKSSESSTGWPWPGPGLLHSARSIRQPPRRWPRCRRRPWKPQDQGRWISKSECPRRIGWSGGHHRYRGGRLGTCPRCWPQTQIRPTFPVGYEVGSRGGRARV